jgi:hypothetical protein
MLAVDIVSLALTLGMLPAALVAFLARKPVAPASFADTRIRVAGSPEDS